MNKFEDLVKELTPVKEDKPKTYTAEVSHTDDEGIVWVRLPGAEQDTPTASTSSEVKMGDTVTVEWRNNKLYIAGNYTNPSAGVTRVAKAEQTAEKAVSDAETARAAAESAQETATEAIAIAGDTDQHFWFTETGTDTGAHITEATQDDFLADPTNGGGNLLARSNGIAARDGLNELATFAASGARIGQNGQSRLDMDFHSLQLKDKEGNTYFHVSDLRDASGEFENSEEIILPYANTKFSVGYSPVTSVSVLVVNSEDWLSHIVSFSGSQIVLDTQAPAKSVINITYTTTSTSAKAYTLGLRKADSPIGALSLCEGKENIASGYASHAEGYSVEATDSYSHAEGYDTKAHGRGAHAEGCYTNAVSRINSPTAMGIHAEGCYTTASNDSAHAEGYHTTASDSASHAEGNYTTASGNYAHAEGDHTTASGKSSHAEGQRTIAEGLCSHAEGLWTRAIGRSQHVFGENNIVDPAIDSPSGYGWSRGTYIEIVGNGLDGSEGSNARTLDWSGNETLAGYISLPNLSDGGAVKIKDKDGTSRSAMYVSAENSLVFGYPWYNGNVSGNCYIGGKMLYLRSIDGVNVNKSLFVDGNIDTDGYIHLKTNGKSIWLTDKDGTSRGMMWLNSNNYFGLGYDMYNNNLGETRIYGDSLKMYSHNTITMSQPLIVGGHSSQIGDIKTAHLTADKSVAKETGTALCSISLPAGTWLILGRVRFPANSTGTIRRANITATSGANDLHVQIPANGYIQQTNFTAIVAPTATTTYYLNVYHNATSALTFVTGTSEGAINGIRAVRIA